MGSLFLYLLVQALGTLVFAYSAGVVAFGNRRLWTVAVAAGLYLFLGAALAEMAVDRMGWSATLLALHYGLVVLGASVISAGVMLKEDAVGGSRRVLRLLSIALVATALVLATTLIALSEGSEVFIDGDGLSSAEAGEGFDHMETAGFLTALPLALGAISMVVVSAGRVLSRGEAKMVWFWGAGVLFLLWPLNIKVASLPMMPAILLIGSTLTYLGMQPKGTEEDEEEPKQDTEQGAEPEMEVELRNGEPDWPEGASGGSITPDEE